MKPVIMLGKVGFVTKLFDRRSGIAMSVVSGQHGQYQEPKIIGDPIGKVIVYAVVGVGFATGIEANIPTLLSHLSYGNNS